MTVPLLTSNWPTMLRQSADWRLVRPSYVPVSISVGLPRNVPWVRRLPRVPEITPYGLLQRPRLPMEEFEARFLARMEKAGVDTIRAQFDSIYADYQNPLVLLCWEPTGEPCHRRMFAEWWQAQTGQRVPEAQGLDRLSITQALGAASR